MLKKKEFKLSSLLAYILMAVIYCSVAIYFISIRTNMIQIGLTIGTFVLGAIFYFKISFKQTLEKN